MLLVLLSLGGIPFVAGFWAKLYVFWAAAQVGLYWLVALGAVLEEMFEEPGAKVVVFSQWLRMHGVLTRRFAGRQWSYVLFHGGRDGEQRRALIDRFREEARCRGFLSTDAGGVGLNLQHASAVVNVDLPWNPAVIEQRIGRVHRLGQTRPVRVVSCIAKGTIEEGMLSLLELPRRRARPAPPARLGNCGPWGRHFGRRRPAHLRARPRCPNRPELSQDSDAGARGHRPRGGDPPGPPGRPPQIEGRSPGSPG